MTFLNKLGGIAKNIGDKTSEVVETTKLNSKINSEKTAIAECLRQIGEIYYQKYLAGDPGDPAAAEFLASIDNHNRVIADAQAEISRIKADGSGQASGAAAPAGEGMACTSCGKLNPAGTKFCAECGGKVEAPVQTTEENACPGCGAQVSPGGKFCGNCGHKFE